GRRNRNGLAPEAYSLFESCTSRPRCAVRPARRARRDSPPRAAGQVAPGSLVDPAGGSGGVAASAAVGRWGAGRVKTPALDAWRREIAAGARTIYTFDPLWRAACEEMNALEAPMPKLAASCLAEA